MFPLNWKVPSDVWALSHQTQATDRQSKYYFTPASPSNTVILWDQTASQEKEDKIRRQSSQAKLPSIDLFISWTLRLEATISAKTKWWWETLLCQILTLSYIILWQLLRHSYEPPKLPLRVTTILMLETPNMKKDFLGRIDSTLVNNMGYRLKSDRTGSQSRLSVSLCALGKSLRISEHHLF